ncbi:hypothetical protein QWI17_06300 [Gilvimarinus sp. SDUM040013]|uniref:Cardiolipin synthase N-terminal domain-containing protein n=1 Tax=Gilvimarinus gilvus TaxID=3058038 RepID=A0ABU4S2H6_9GAMM|nr:hypothetical protein [Gilvimarinus sp. SDUM040013]MDO3385449.1 hypothetical protein [Gilvimarinus sp. SDUM040013]MDX6851134.1 hypothetical protein [Gilvimarinus sp. SDUM040013]
MEQVHAYGLLIIALIVLTVFNALISWDVYCWTPSFKKKIGLLLLVWLAPFIGFLLANKIGKLGWFKKPKKDRGTTSISGGFMEADSFFNPGMKHRMEIVEKQQAQQESSSQNPTPKR